MWIQALLFPFPIHPTQGLFTGYEYGIQAVTACLVQVLTMNDNSDLMNHRALLTYSIRFKVPRH